MSRLMTRSALAALALAGGLMYMTAGPSGQATGQPSTKNGDWPAYAGDIKGTRYSPADHQADEHDERETGENRSSE